MDERNRKHWAVFASKDEIKAAAQARVTFCDQEIRSLKKTESQAQNNRQRLQFYRQKRVEYQAWVTFLNKPTTTDRLTLTFDDYQYFFADASAGLNW